MIDRLFDFFEGLVGEADEQMPHDEAIALAAAALMLEVARSDSNKQDIELEMISEILLKEFDVERDSVEALIDSAHEKVETAHDLYQFTRLINDHYSYSDKEFLLLAMWRVAYADGHIESFEDHVIRRVAGLIHLAHADFIRLKIQARDS